MPVSASQVITSLHTNCSCVRTMDLVAGSMLCQSPSITGVTQRACAGVAVTTLAVTERPSASSVAASSVATSRVGRPRRTGLCASMDIGTTLPEIDEREVARRSR
jgi:hypothetical protein